MESLMVMWGRVEMIDTQVNQNHRRKKGYSSRWLVWKNRRREGDWSSLLAWMKRRWRIESDRLL